jgi:hypothetical protein
MDEGMVLLQGTLTCMPARREVYPRLRSHKSALHFRMEPPFDCPDDDLSDAAFA